MATASPPQSPLDAPSWVEEELADTSSSEDDSGIRAWRTTLVGPRRDQDRVSMHESVVPTQFMTKYKPECLRWSHKDVYYKLKNADVFAGDLNDVLTDQDEQKEDTLFIPKMLKRACTLAIIDAIKREEMKTKLKTQHRDDNVDITPVYLFRDGVPKNDVLKDFGYLYYSEEEDRKKRGLPEADGSPAAIAVIFWPLSPIAPITKAGTGGSLYLKSGLEDDRVDRCAWTIYEIIFQCAGIEENIPGSSGWMRFSDDSAIIEILVGKAPLKWFSDTEAYFVDDTTIADTLPPISKGALQPFISHARPTSPPRPPNTRWGHGNVPGKMPWNVSGRGWVAHFEDLEDVYSRRKQGSRNPRKFYKLHSLTATDNNRMKHATYSPDIDTDSSEWERAKADTDRQIRKDKLRQERKRKAASGRESVGQPLPKDRPPKRHRKGAGAP